MRTAKQNIRIRGTIIYTVLAALALIAILTSCGPSAQQRFEDPHGYQQKGQRFEVIHNIEGTGSCVVIWYSGYANNMEALPTCKKCKK